MLAEGRGGGGGEGGRGQGRGGPEMRTRHEASSVGRKNCDQVLKHSNTPLGMQRLVSSS